MSARIALCGIVCVLSASGCGGSAVATDAAPAAAAPVGQSSSLEVRVPASAEPESVAPEPLLRSSDLASLLPAEEQIEIERLVRGESARVRAAFRDGDIIVRIDDLLLILDAATRDVRSVIRHGMLQPHELMPLPDPKALIVGNGTEFRVLDLSPHPRSGTAASRRVAEVRGWRSAALSPDGASLAVWIGERIELWDVATGTKRRMLDLGRGDVRCLGFTGDDRVVAVQEDLARFWDARTGLPEPFVARWGDASLFPVRLVRGGEFLVALSADEVALLHTRSGTREWGLPLPRQETVNLMSGGATLTEDGSRVFVARGGSVQLWDRSGGVMVSEWQVPNRGGQGGSDVREVSVAPSGEVALAQTYSGTARLLDLRSSADESHSPPAAPFPEFVTDDWPLTVPTGLDAAATAEWLRLEHSSRAAEHRYERAADGSFVLPDYPTVLRRKLEQIGLLRSELGDRDPHVCAAIQELSRYFNYAGRPEESERALREAAELFEGLDPAGGWRPDAPFDDLGDLAEKKGHVGEAIRWYEKALALDRGDRLYGGKARPALARLYEAAGRLNAAEAMLVEQLDEYEAKLPDGVGTTRTRELLAAFYARHRREGESLALAARQLADLTRKRGPDHPDVGDGCLALAERMAEAGRPDLAAESAGHGFRIQRNYVASTLPFLGGAERAKFLKERYRPAYGRALAVAARNPRRPEAARAVEWVLNGKSIEARAFAAVRRLGAAGPEGDPAATSYAEARRRLAELSSAAAPDREAVAEASARADALARGLAKRDWRKLEADRWVTADEVRAALLDHEVLVEFSFIPLVPPKGASNPSLIWEVGAWVVPPTGKGDVTFTRLGDAAEVASAVRSAYAGMSTAGSTDGSSPGAEDARFVIDRGLDGLARRVLRPLLARIGGYRTWVVSPDHVLWTVPWAALPVEPGVFTVERHELALVASGRDLLSGRRRAAVGPPLIVADPDFDAGLAGPTGRPSFSPLPQTADEARRVADALSARPGAARPKVLTGAEATEAAVKATRSPELLLLSTHGYVGFARPGVSEPLADCGVGLAGANAAVSAGGDGLLTGSEVLNMDLRGTRLVALSACQTGAGTVQVGEGVASLRQAFHVAGAEAVVASLWPVPVVETADLMAYLFEARGDAGHAAALAEAQRRLIIDLRSGRGYADPRLWAAFDVTFTR